MPRRAAADPALPALASRSEALRAGLTPGQVQQRLRSGAWQRVSWGFYLTDPDLGDELDRYVRARLEHVRRAIAARRRNPLSIIAWHSASLVHGLPLFDTPPDEVCLLVPPGQWTGRRSGVVFRASADRFGLDGGPVTTVARTWVDIARHHRLADALSVGDAAIRRGVVRVEELRAAADAVTSGRGSRRVRQAVAHVDGRRETPLESGSWAYFVEHSLPLPTPQVEFRDEDGRFVARVDFAWDGRAVVGECDGRLKYAEPDSLYAEKRREDALRAMGLTVVRWGMGDLRDARLATRLRSVLH